jgi:hypothetical protein
MMAEGEFNVFWWDPDGNYHKELSNVDAETAVKFAMDFPKRPAGLLGFIQRVIITDGGDFCVYEWKHGEGVTYPERNK